MRFPCNFKDTVYNRHLAKGFVSNNNAKNKQQYCTVSIKGYLQPRKIEEVEKTKELYPNAEIIW